MSRKYKAGHRQQRSLFSVAGGLAAKFAEAVRDKAGFVPVGGDRYQRVVNGRAKGPVVTLPMATMIASKLS